MRSWLKILFLFCFLAFGSGGWTVANAQGPGDGGGCDGTGIDPDNPCPIDGGLAVLLIAGVAYGVKKSRVNKKEESGQRDYLS